MAYGILMDLHNVKPVIDTLTKKMSGLRSLFLKIKNCAFSEIETGFPHSAAKSLYKIRSTSTPVSLYTYILLSVIHKQSI